LPELHLAIVVLELAIELWFRWAHVYARDNKRKQPLESIDRVSITAPAEVNGRESRKRFADSIPRIPIGFRLVGVEGDKESFDNSSHGIFSEKALTLTRGMFTDSPEEFFRVIPP